MVYQILQSLPMWEEEEYSSAAVFSGFRHLHVVSFRTVCHVLPETVHEAQVCQDTFLLLQGDKKVGVTPGGA